MFLALENTEDFVPALFVPYVRTSTSIPHTPSAAMRMESLPA